MHQRQLSDYKTHKNMLHGWTFSRKQKYNKKLTGMSEMKHKKKRSMKTHNAHKKHKKYKTKQSTKCGQPQTQWNEVANGHIQSSSEQFLSMHIEMIKEIETRREKKNKQHRRQWQRNGYGQIQPKKTLNRFRTR